MSETVDPEDTDDAPAPVADPDTLLQSLQAEPQRYRLFGVWWWAIKALLRGRGYTRDQASFRVPSSWWR